MPVAMNEPSDAADGLAIHPGFLVPNGHGDTREQRSLGVDHPAPDFGCSLLS